MIVLSNVHSKVENGATATERCEQALGTESHKPECSLTELCISDLTITATNSTRGHISWPGTTKSELLHRGACVMISEAECPV